MFYYICIIIITIPIKWWNVESKWCWDMLRPKISGGKGPNLLQVALDVGAHHLDERISELLFLASTNL